MNDNNNFDENNEEIRNNISSESSKNSVSVKDLLKNQFALFLAAFFGFGFISPLSYVFGIYSSASIVGQLIRKPSPIAFAGTVLGFLLSLFASFSVESIFMLVFYLLPVIPLYICTLRCGKISVASYGGLYREDGGCTVFALNGYSKTVTAGVMSAVYFALFAFAFALSVIAVNGTFGIDSIKDYISSYMDLLYTASEELFSAMAATGEATIPTETIKQAIQTVYLLSVSFVVVLCFSCGYFSTVFLKMSLKSGKILDKVFPCGYKLQISFISAIVYILISTIHMLLSFGNDASMYFVFYNLKIILTHIFLAYGFERAMDFLEDRSELYGAYFKITAIIAALMLSMLLYTILPAVGALVILRNTMKAFKEKMNDNDRGDNE